MLLPRVLNWYNILPSHVLMCPAVAPSSIPCRFIQANGNSHHVGNETGQVGMLEGWVLSLGHRICHFEVSNRVKKPENMSVGRSITPRGQKACHFWAGMDESTSFPHCWNKQVVREAMASYTG